MKLNKHAIRPYSGWHMIKKANGLSWVRAELNITCILKMVIYSVLNKFTLVASTWLAAYFIDYKLYEKCTFPYIQSTMILNEYFTLSSSSNCIL